MGVEIMNEEAIFYGTADDVLSDLDLIYHFRNVLSAVSSGDREDYEELLGVVNFDRKKNGNIMDNKPFGPDHVAQLVTSFKALSGAVSYIDTVQHGTLLAAIFGMNMWSHGPDVMDALLELIISLAASSGKYVDACLEMLVCNFTPPDSFIHLLKHSRGIAKKHQVLSRVHSALQDLADLVPLSPMRLSPLVIHRKPFLVNATKETIVIYVENMLRLEGSVFGELVRSTMLSGVVDLLLDLDLEIGWDDIVHDDSSKGIFDMELEEIDKCRDDVLNDGGAHPREVCRKSSGGNSFAEKLDSVMVVMFEHLESCKAGGRLTEVFEALLQSFQKTVLTAYKSKFAQFVMFYACTLDPETCGLRFAMMLADIFVCNDNSQHFVRMSAVAYLASYLSRAKFLSTSFVATMLKRLVDWCLDYCNMQEGEVNPEAHRIFYSGCQAIMYVLCFRMRSLTDVPQLRALLFGLPIDSILTHKLSPLKVCLPSVVTVFLRQAKAAHLFTTAEKFSFDDYLLESELSRAFGGIERLDMFFPFDPCLLKISDSMIRPNFVYWSMVRPCDDDEEDNSDDEIAEAFVETNGECIMNDEISKNFGDFDLDDFDSALNKMSITPKDSFNHRLGIALKQPMRMPSRIRPSTSPESL
ncbi:hypothetical protein FNV43_RR19189 [Rhamnella rubrinervis]|uniref:RNA polymerase I-specific transcription initiation factor RRN3 n=1 Tax=Rhamnella rubrinervis TaxID=2594499 RepID=A0A8K0E577_9ROSA|nr:hypothetical protein FNV43_RR19189 [Rhamnella rubrinervis]